MQIPVLRVISSYRQFQIQATKSGANGLCWSWECVIGYEEEMWFVWMARMEIEWALDTRNPWSLSYKLESDEETMAILFHRKKDKNYVTWRCDWILHKRGHFGFVTRVTQLMLGNVQVICQQWCETKSSIFQCTICWIPWIFC